MSETEKKNEIKLVQKPIIVHSLAAIGAEIKERIAGLNLDNLVFTEETRAAAKATRTDLNAEFKEYETQRGIIKKACNEPYDAFNAEYKLHITDVITPAIAKVAKGINDIEDGLKNKMKAILALYFAESCVAAKIDFLDFNKVVPKMDLTTKEAKHKKNIAEYLEKIKSEVELINAHDFASEIMIEYKSSLEAAKSINKVKERKRLLKEAAEKAKVVEDQNRIAELVKIGFSYEEMANTYVYDDELYVNWDVISKMKVKAFSAELYRLTQAVNAKIEAAKPVVVEEPVPSPTVSHVSGQRQAPPTAPPIPKAPAAPLAKPDVAPPIQDVKAKFEVVTTMIKLKALAAYMREQKIEFQTIK